MFGFFLILTFGLRLDYSLASEVVLDIYYPDSGLVGLDGKIFMLGYSSLPYSLTLATSNYLPW